MYCSCNWSAPLSAPPVAGSVGGPGGGQAAGAHSRGGEPGGADHLPDQPGPGESRLPPPSCSPREVAPLSLR